jgi:hypothetical protein
MHTLDDQQTVGHACLLAHYVAVNICGPHRKHVLRPGSVVACAYFGRCLEMGVHVTVFKLPVSSRISYTYVSVAACRPTRLSQPSLRLPILCGTPCVSPIPIGAPIVSVCHLVCVSFHCLSSQRSQRSQCATHLVEPIPFC